MIEGSILSLMEKIDRIDDERAKNQMAGFCAKMYKRVDELYLVYDPNSIRNLRVPLSADVLSFQGSNSNRRDFALIDHVETSDPQNLQRRKDYTKVCP